MFKIINGVLIKCNSNEKEINLPDNVRVVLASAFNNNVEVINGINVERIVGVLDKPNIKVLNCPKLCKAKIECKNLEELYVSENFKSNRVKYIPNKINIDNDEYLFDTSARDRYKEVNDLCELNLYDEKSNVIHLFNGSKKYYDNSDKLIESVITLNKVLNMIPDEFKEVILNSDYDIFVTNVYMFMNNDYVAGIAYKKYKLVIISEHNIMELIHELGHVYDYETGISSDEYFKEIYEKEKNKIYEHVNTSKVMCEHIKSSKEEFFAESFKKYILRRDDFEKECPLTKNFLDNVLEKENNKVR